MHTWILRIALTVVGSFSLADAAAASPVAPPDTIFSVSKTESKVTYHLVHKMHKVDGVSNSVEGKAKVLPTGQILIALRAPVESFDSKNSNRDAHMKEVLEAAKYPEVEVKASVEDVGAPATYPTTVDKTVKAQVALHGVKQTIEVPVKIIFESPGRIKVQTSFGISLDSFKVERPSLLFIKVNDELKLDADLVLAK